MRRGGTGRELQERTRRDNEEEQWEFIYANHQQFVSGVTGASAAALEENLRPSADLWPSQPNSVSPSPGDWP